jgi:hypothetical protein
MTTDQFGKSGARRWAARACIFLVLLMVGVEATHAHRDAASPRTSSPCAICISVHANAPAVAFHPLPTLSALETLAIAFQAQGKGIVKEISLFIRPPPASDPAC